MNWPRSWTFPLPAVLARQAFAVSLLSLSALSTAEPAASAGGERKAAPALNAPASAEPRPGTAWVKLCNTSNTTGTKACRIAHERLDGDTGKILIAAEFWDVADNPDERTLFIRVRPGFVAQAGLRIGFYKPAEWELASQHVRIDDKKLTVVTTKALLCTSDLCTGQIRVSRELWRDMGSYAGFMVLAMDVAKKPVGFPVPMTGFTKTASGPEMDLKKYEQARSKLIRGIGDKPRD
ncbi:MAG: invasion associated locus B family protein [Hyphomicrobium sp.]